MNNAHIPPFPSEVKENVLARRPRARLREGQLEMKCQGIGLTMPEGGCHLLLSIPLLVAEEFPEGVCH